MSYMPLPHWHRCLACDLMWDALLDGRNCWCCGRFGQASVSGPVLTSQCGYPPMLPA